MQHTVNFKVGEAVFIPATFSNGSHTQAVILSVGRKYVKAVAQAHYQTEDEKEMTFNIDLNSLETKLTGNYTRKVYQSAEQYLQIQKAQELELEKFAKLKAINWTNVDPKKIDQILEILEG